MSVRGSESNGKMEGKRRKAQEILGGKFSKCGGYKSEVGGMAKMQCIHNRDKLCKCIVLVLIESIDEYLNETLDQRFIQAYSKDLHQDSCEFAYSNTELQRVIDGFDYEDFQNTVEEIKRRNRKMSNSNNMAELDAKYQQLQVEVDLLKLRCTQLEFEQSKNVQYEKRIADLQKVNQMLVNQNTELLKQSQYLQTSLVYHLKTMGQPAMELPSANMTPDQIISSTDLSAAITSGYEPNNSPGMSLDTETDSTELIEDNHAFGQVPNLGQSTGIFGNPIPPNVPRNYFEMVSKLYTNRFKKEMQDN